MTLPRPAAIAAAYQRLVLAALAIGCAHGSDVGSACDDQDLTPPTSASRLAGRHEQH